MKNTSIASDIAPRKTLWRSLASPAYLFSKASFIALFNLLLLAALASVVGSLSATLIFLLLLPLAGMAFGYFERWRLNTMGFGPLENNHVEVSRSNIWEWIKFRYTEPASWREVLALIVASMIGAISAGLLIVEISVFFVAIGLMVSLLRGQEITNWSVFSHQGDYFIEQNSAVTNAQQVFALPDITSNLWWIFLLLALLTIPLSAYLNGVVAATSGSISKSLLAQRPEEYERQLEKISASRSTIMDSFETERRRIERDLHDGVQQELVNVNMRLGLAEMEAKRLISNGVDVQLLTDHVSGARVQINHALETLRNTVRGIYPAVLETHGLGAALDELAHHTLLPVRLNYLVNERLNREVERTAYYVASEGIANALKHSKASEIGVEAVTTQNNLVLSVTDHGVGGAHIGTGSGLSGLAERVATLGGQLSVSSPQGGPTVLRAELPLRQG